MSKFKLDRTPTSMEEKGDLLVTDRINIIHYLYEYEVSSISTAKHAPFAIVYSLT